MRKVWYMRWICKPQKEFLVEAISLLSSGGPFDEMDEQEIPHKK